MIAPEFRAAFREFNQRICSDEKSSLECAISGLAGQRRHMETHAAHFPGCNGGFVQLGTITLAHAKAKTVDLFLVYHCPPKFRPARAARRKAAGADMTTV